MSFTQLKEIGTGFWNLRASFKLLGGMVDIGTHMSFIRLESGKILVIDTCNVGADAKAEIDQLTDNGNLIEAVIATHPYHTLAFVPFFKLYPQAKYYGTPRHCKVITEIEWSGDVNDTAIREIWEPEVYMRIPAGSDFATPGPNNHFSNVFVFHKKSKTIHNDDTIMYTTSAGCLARAAGVKSNCFQFHLSLKSVGLYPTAEAPLEFKAWVQSIISDWDFDNLCSAHNGVKIGGAKAMLEAALVDATPVLESLSNKHKK